MTFKEVKDHGGARETSETGGVREAATGKGRFDLVPSYPHLRLAQHYENGAKKYADRNWEKGLPLARFIDSAERHMNQFKSGDRTEDHLAAILWNIYGYIWTEKEIAEGRLPVSLRNVPWSASTSMASLLQQVGVPPMQAVFTTTPTPVEIDVTRPPAPDFVLPRALARQEDGSELLSGAETRAERELRGLLEKREEDVKNGRLIEYDHEQANVPPYLRKKP